MSRIIAGAARGRRLATPDGDQTRPTTDRVREALFSALASWAGGADADPAQSLAGLAVLDLYAGSGAVGLEAASRGAAPVWLVESDRKTADLIRRNASELGLGGSATGGRRVSVQAAKAETFAAGPPPTTFDVIWADPPYRLESEALDSLVAALVDGGWLVRNGLIVLERAKRDPAPAWPAVIDDTWQRRYGETTLYFGQRGEPADPAPDCATNDQATNHEPSPNHEPATTHDHAEEASR